MYVLSFETAGEMTPADRRTLKRLLSECVRDTLLEDVTVSIDQHEVGQNR